MIKTLAPLGGTHRISVLLDYTTNNSPDTVTATVIVTPKPEGAQPLTFQIAGTVDELEAGFAAQLTEAVAKITATATDLSSLDAQLAAAKKAKEEELAAAKSKPTTKPAAAAAKPSKSKPAKKEEAKDDDEEEDEEDEKPEAPAETPAAPATSTAGAPSPAWKKQQALTPAPTPPAAPAAQQPLELGDI